MKIIPLPTRTFALWLGIMFLALTMEGCGGGGTRNRTTGGGGTPTGEPTIALTLKNAASGASSNTATAGAPLAAEATVRDASGATVSNVVVTFSTTATSVGTLSPSSGTALTNSGGVARILIQAGADSGADTLKASVAVGSGTAEASVGYQSSAPNVSLGPLQISPAGSLSAGGTAGVTVSVQDGSGAPFLSPVEVTFSSECAGQGKATIGSPSTTVNGLASTSYVDQGCANTDIITATLQLNGSSRSASLVVLAASAGSIQFVSATPTTVAIKGTGGVEASTVRFRVLGTTGLPVSNVPVDFSLNTAVGGLQISPAVATSGVDGTVQTTVQAGTIATPVRVTARLSANNTISTVSEQLTVTTAIPHQNGFSISASTLNIEGLDFDGTPSTITARLSDHFGNPVSDGTAVVFRTEGGISATTPASCVTAAGACSVTLTSSGNRSVLVNGRLRILATAIGEESYTDANANGVYDLGEPFTDLPEAFLDANESGKRNNFSSPGVLVEEFVDFNLNGTFDLGDGAIAGPADSGDGIFNGVLRASNTGATTLNVRSSLDIVLSGSGALFNENLQNPTNFPSLPGSPPNPNSPVPALPPVISVACRSQVTQTVVVRVTDRNGQILPAGTTVQFSTTAGKLATNPTSFTVPNTNSTLIPVYSVTVASGGSFPECDISNPAGAFNISVTTPKGLNTLRSISVIDNP